MLLPAFSSVVFAHTPYTWAATSSGIFRNGDAFYLNGQSWGKMTDFTYLKGAGAETIVKQKLTELNEIGINVLRLYGSPDENDWGESSANYGNLITWIEEWNVANPDNGDPNDAMYYMVQLSPKDPQSSITKNLPENTSTSFDRAINDHRNPGSVASMVQHLDNITGGSKYLLGYLIYHEFNYSPKYADWYQAIEARGIEDFMNAVADAIHNTLAPGKLVSHTGDLKSTTTDIYDEIEDLDSAEGNVFESFDLIGFNLYASTDSLLSENAYYDKIVQHRSLSVNNNRGWFVGENGASYDLDADPEDVQAANYTNPGGIANLQILRQKCEELGNMIGFMMFTVQDNDKRQTSDFNSMKQRGHFDFYGDKKFLYFAYPDIIDEISINKRHHSTDDHDVGVTIINGSGTYTVSFEFENKTSSSKDFFWSIHGDDEGSSSQRFTDLVEQEFLTLSAGQSTTVVRTVLKPSSNNLFAVTATVIEDLTPTNSYLWGREHLLSDAIGTVAGLNLNVNNLPSD